MDRLSIFRTIGITLQKMPVTKRAELLARAKQQLARASGDEPSLMNALIAAAILSEWTAQGLLPSEHAGKVSELKLEASEIKKLATSSPDRVEVLIGLRAPSSSRAVCVWAQMRLEATRITANQKAIAAVLASNP